ncbi:MAG: Hsp20/alpha crystallin family protein [Candidatus Thermoplasmatota archaeon]|nr:Hsp20/alpha crystallin family protein [Candidatus Sysuiplasma jiujiangense]MCL5253882.1 Hsp20/alpha crystallin family protein [Candidatus Thermoplasmatota archaeon]
MINLVDNSTVIKAYPRKSGLRTRNFDDFFEDMPRTFAEWMRPFFRDFPSLGFFEPWTSENSMVPYMDIQEADKEYNVTVDLPGVMKEDIEVKVTEDNTIEITGKRNEKKEERNANYLRQERSSYNFHRSFSLPEEIDGEKVEAKVENGVLFLRLPKKEEAARKVKKVEIK